MRAIGTGSPAGEVSFIYARGSNWTLSRCVFLTQTAGFIRFISIKGLKIVDTKALTMAPNTSVYRILGATQGATMRNCIGAGLLGNWDNAAAMADPDKFIASIIDSGTAKTSGGYDVLTISGEGLGTATGVSVDHCTFRGGKIKVLNGVQAADIGFNDILSRDAMIGLNGSTASAKTHDNLLRAYKDAQWGKGWRGIQLENGASITVPSNNFLLDPNGMPPSQYGPGVSLASSIPVGVGASLQ